MARLSPMNWLRRSAISLLCLTAPATAADLGSVQGFDIRLDTTLRGSLGLHADRLAQPGFADRRQH